MSTSCTIFNLTKKTGYYLDYAYWIIGACESGKLYTSAGLHTHAMEAKKDIDARGQEWLELALEWVRANPACAFVILTDTENWDLLTPFDDFCLVNP